MAENIPAPSLEQPAHASYNHGLILQTARLRLRDHQLADAPEIHAIRAHPLTLQNIGMTPPAHIDETRAWLQARETTPNTFRFTVELKEAAADSATTIIGMCGGIRTPEFGYMIDPAYWGKGYATEAMRAAIDAYWREYPDGMPGLPEEQRHEITLYISENNYGSNRVAEKLGFTRSRDSEMLDKEGKPEHPKVWIWTLERP